MLMKKILLVVFFIAICNFINAQQQIDARIQEVYGNKTEELVANNPELLNFLNNLLNHRIKIQEDPATKGESKFTKLSQVKLLNKYNPSLTRDEVFDPANFNPLKYNFEISSNSATKVYQVDNTNYLIVIEPQSTTNNH